MERTRLRPLSRLEEAGVGAACGSIEVFLMQPTVFWKTELQQGRFDIKRAVQPRYLYRGTSIAATSIAPITAIQFSVNGACMSSFGAEGGVAGTLLSGVAAGVVSALVQSPCQLVEINQQKHGGSMGGLVKRGARSLSHLFLTFSATFLAPFLYGFVVLRCQTNGSQLSLRTGSLQCGAGSR